jgi:hypothetical protein
MPLDRPDDHSPGLHPSLQGDPHLLLLLPPLRRDQQRGPVRRQAAGLRCRNLVPVYGCGGLESRGDQVIALFY